MIATAKTKQTSPSRQPAEPLTKKDALTQPAYKLSEGREEATLRREEHGEPAAVVGCELRTEEPQGKERNDEQDENGIAQPEPASGNVQSDAAASGMLHRIQEALGICMWAKLKGTIQSQSQEFQHQVYPILG